MSFGVLQWNFGSGTLQPLLQGLLKNHHDMMLQVFDPVYLAILEGELKEPLKKQIEWANSISIPPNKRSLYAPWRERFKGLGRTPECQEAQVTAAEYYFGKAEAMMKSFGFTSERAFALCFDIAVQNGSVRRRALDTYYAICGTRPVATEKSKLIYLANAVAESANLKWVEDVRSRKLVIATGAGVVHGIRVNLDDYGITMSSSIQE
jgi:hypothetical protein